MAGAVEAGAVLTTARGYDWIIRTYIIPTLGSVPLARPADVAARSLLRQAARDRRAGRQAALRGHHRPSGARDPPPAMQQGIQWGWIATNPAALASPPRVRALQMQPPESSDLVHLIEQASLTGPRPQLLPPRGRDDRGAPRGAVLLRWRDVDLAARAVTMTRSVVEAADGVIVEKDTKTHGSRRIALDDDTAAALEAQRERMAARASASRRSSPRTLTCSRAPRTA